MDAIRWRPLCIEMSAAEAGGEAVVAPPAEPSWPPTNLTALDFLGFGQAELLAAERADVLFLFGAHNAAAASALSPNAETPGWPCEPADPARFYRCTETADIEP
eukprot:SAG11_NODE_5621_length_1505_cov_1.978663_1_plen_103_part_10